MAKEKKATGVMAKWGKMKWKCTSNLLLPLENDLSIKYSINEKNKKEKQTISFSYIPNSASGANVKAEVKRWNSLVGKVNPLYIGKKRFGPKKLKLKSASVSEINVYGNGQITQASIALTFEEKRKKSKKTSKKKNGTTKKAQKTTKKKAKSR